MAMTMKQAAIIGVHSLNTREGFDYIFSYGMSLCEEYYIPANTLPVELVLDDIEDMFYNPCSTLPIPSVRDLIQLPF